MLHEYEILHSLDGVFAPKTDAPSFPMHPAALLRLLLLLAGIAGIVLYLNFQKELQRQSLPDEAAMPAQPTGWTALAKKVEQSRGLEFKTMPKFQAVSTVRLQEIQHQLALRRFAEGQDAIKIRADSALGFRWQPAYPFSEAMAGLAQEEQGCAYDEAEATIYYEDKIDPKAPSSVKGKWFTTMAEILLRQHFPKSPTASDDEQLAAAALAMGDARQTMLKCVMGDPDALPPLIAGSENAAVPFSATPPYFRERFLFASAYGDYYAGEATGRTLENPPRSTSEIMHPDMPGFDPKLVTLPNLPDLKSVPIFENVAGEYQIFLLLKSQLTHEDAEVAAEGWRGDRYAVYPGPKGATEPRPVDHLLWMSTWASPNDAEEFSETMFRFLLARHGIMDDPKFHLENGALRVRGFSRAFSILKDPADENGVIVMSATTDEFADQLEKQLLLKK